MDLLLMCESNTNSSTNHNNQDHLHKKPPGINNSNDLAVVNKSNNDNLKTPPLNQFCQEIEREISTPQMYHELQTLIEERELNEKMLIENPNPTQKHHQQQQHNFNVVNNYSSTLSVYMPQPVHFGSTRSLSDTNSKNTSDLSDYIAPYINDEPLNLQIIENVYQQANTTAVQVPLSNTFYPPSGSGNFVSNGSGSTLTTLTPSTLPEEIHYLGLGTSEESFSSKHQPRQRKGGKYLDKTSEEYKRRRLKNNLAVRRSRARRKIRSLETDEKAIRLAKDNEELLKENERLYKELNESRKINSFFSSFFATSDSDSVLRHLMNHSFPFQQQHQDQ